MKKIFLSTMILALLLTGCRSDQSDADASGTFEATETIVSAEASGKLLLLNISEGQSLTRNQPVGVIDSTALHLNKLQLEQNKRAVLAGRQDVKTQLESLERELENANADQRRIENLVKGQVASQKQLDDANLRIGVLKARIDAQSSMLNTTNTSLNEQSKTIAVQLKVVEDQLRRCRVINPVDGMVLAKYAEAFEMAAVGKPLYKVADISSLILRAYISGNQLTSVKLGQRVKVLVDDVEGKTKPYEGLVEWVSDKAEFTPKTIQTKDERANLVYGMKVRVVNDGSLKIGMYADLVLKP